MNLKRFFSWLVLLSFITFVFPSSALAGVASDSDADYGVMTLEEDYGIMPFATVVFKVSARVNGSWRDISPSSTDGYYLPSGTDLVSIDLPPKRGVIFSGAEYVTTIGSDYYNTNGSFVSGVYNIPVKPFTNSQERMYFYNSTDYKQCVLLYMGASGVTLKKTGLFQTPSTMTNAPNVTIGGVYSTTDGAIKLSEAYSPSHGDVSLIHSISCLSSSYHNYFFAPSNGILKKGYEYTFNFYTSYGSNVNYRLRTRSSNVSFSSGVVDGTNVSFTFVASRDYTLDELFFFVDTKSSVASGAFFYLNSSSSYIPAADTGQQGQVTASNTTIIKNVVSNIQNTVSNISNKITNMTTTITNTINSAVSNAASAITNNATQNANKITANADGNANKITQNANQNATNITNNANTNTNKVTANADKNTTNITNNANQNTDKVTANADKNTTNITNNANQNTNKVTANADKNTTNITNNANQNTNKVTANADKNTNIITKALVELGNFLIEGLKSLFIPSDQFFKSWFDNMYQFFHDRLGFLMLPIDLVIQVIDVYTSANSSFAGVPFPELKWVDGTVVIPAQTVGFDFLQTSWGKDIQKKLYFVTNLIMIGSLFMLMHRKMEEVLKG